MPQSYRNIHVIINPASGQNEPILNTLNDVFSAYDLDWAVSITKNAGDGARFATEAVERGCDLVMAYGGDGTILDVAGGLLHGDIPLCILPGGTANALAADLMLPSTLREAAALALGPHAIRAIDVGKTGERYFLLRVGTGMVATFSEGVTREMKDRFGIAAYIISGIQAIATPQYVDYYLTIDGQAIETSGVACLITNGNAIGALGIRLSQKIKIDDGLLDVYVLNNDLQTIMGITGGITQIEQLELSLEHWQGKEIIVDANPAQKFYADGEEVPFDETPSTIVVLPSALKVLVPANPGE